MDNVIIGLDVGYGSVKAACENGSSLCFPSLMAPAEFIRFQADVGVPVQTNGLTLYDTTDGDLFVGELAARQGRSGAVSSPRDRDWVADPIMTHLATAEEHGIVVDVEDVLVVPQPFGALLSILLDGRDRLMADVAHLAQGRVGVLDIGLFTTDMLLVDGLEYIEAGSGSLEVGVSTALEMLRKVLLDDYRISYDLHQLEVAIRRGWLVIDGATVPLNGWRASA